MLQLALCCPFDLSYLRRYIAWRSCCLESDRCLGGKEVLRNRSFTLLMTSSILTPKRQARVSQQTGQPWLGQWILRVASGGRSYVKSAEGCVMSLCSKYRFIFFTIIHNLVRRPYFCKTAWHKTSTRWHYLFHTLSLDTFHHLDQARFYYDQRAFCWNQYPQGKKCIHH